MGTCHIVVITTISSNIYPGSPAGKMVHYPPRGSPHLDPSVGQALPMSRNPELWSESKGEDLNPIPTWPSPKHTHRGPC